MKKALLTVLAVACLLVIVSCAAGPNPLTDALSAEETVAGFWMGLWHGLIAPITFIISLLSDTVTMYEVHNNGGWYDLGFVLGVGIFAELSS